MNTTSVWKFVKEWAKTISAFVAGVVANMIVNLVQSGTVWPQTKNEWVQYVLTSFGSAIAVALTRNKITQKQLDKDPDVVGGTVVSPEPAYTQAQADDSRADTPPPSPNSPTGSYRNPWK